MIRKTMFCVLLAIFVLQFVSPSLSLRHKAPNACYTCRNATSHEECKRIGRIQYCTGEQNACETLISREGGVPMISKGCGRAISHFCSDFVDCGNRPRICNFCCYSPLCNIGDSFPPNDPCSVNPCQNGGSCESVSCRSMVCNCPDGYKGEFCETPIARPTIPPPTKTTSGKEEVITPGTDAPVVPPKTQPPKPKPTTDKATDAPATDAPTESPKTTPPKPKPTTEKVTRPPATERPTEPAKTQPPKPKPTTEKATEPPVTDAPTEPAKTQPPKPKPTTEKATKPPATDAPTEPAKTQPPKPKPTTEKATKPPATEAPTEPTKTQPPKPNPTTEKATTSPETQTPKPTSASPSPTDAPTESPTKPPTQASTVSDKRRCYTCTNAATNEECNAAGTKDCNMNEESCETDIRKSGNGKIRITKRCKQLTACENNAKGNEMNCDGDKPNPFCYYCCQGDLCNDPLPGNPIGGTKVERKRERIDRLLGFFREFQRQQLAQQQQVEREETELDDAAEETEETEGKNNEGDQQEAGLQDFYKKLAEGHESQEGLEDFYKILAGEEEPPEHVETEEERGLDEFYRILAGNKAAIKAEREQNDDSGVDEAQQGLQDFYTKLEAGHKDQEGLENFYEHMAGEKQGEGRSVGEQLDPQQEGLRDFYNRLAGAQEQEESDEEPDEEAELDALVRGLYNDDVHSVRKRSVLKEDTNTDSTTFFSIVAKLYAKLFKQNGSS